ncbi:MAG TPA: type II toxin-antitoxin system HicB family antitoxin, partial [Allosphingosinicella sp.]|nr:type II toxin-antitoxin system HicB family antitoxin [Allosphingosinicella sp.]
NPRDYEVDVRPLAPELGGGYVAEVPELPGCVSDGDTPEEALANAYDAAGAWLETARELGRDIPVPQAFQRLRYA